LRRTLRHAPGVPKWVTKGVAPEGIVATATQRSNRCRSASARRSENNLGSGDVRLEPRDLQCQRYGMLRVECNGNQAGGIPARRCNTSTRHWAGGNNAASGGAPCRPARLPCLKRVDFSVEARLAIRSKRLSGGNEEDHIEKRRAWCGWAIDVSCAVSLVVHHLRRVEQRPDSRAVLDRPPTVPKTQGWHMGIEKSDPQRGAQILGGKDPCIAVSSALNS